jgi:hypothetical protein
LWFGSQSVSLKRIDSTPIFAAPQIPVQTELLVATASESETICAAGKCRAAADREAASGSAIATT